MCHGVFAAIYPPTLGQALQPPGAWVSWPVEWRQQFDLISGMARDVLGTGPRQWIATVLGWSMNDGSEVLRSTQGCLRQPQFPL